MKISKSSNKEFTPHPPTEAPIRAVIVDITEPEKKIDPQWGEKWRCAVVFETEKKMDDDTNFTIWKHGLTVRREDDGSFGLIVGGKKKSAFEELLGTLEVVIDDNFDTEHLIGIPVRLMVDHKRDDKDATKIHANITYLKRDKGSDPMKPSGNYVRKKDRPANGSSQGGSNGAQYTKVQGGGTAPGMEWCDVKVHVGQFAGSSVGDLPGEDAVDKLLAHWWPTVAAKPLADDRRLHDALLKAKAEFEKAKADANGGGDEIKF